MHFLMLSFVQYSVYTISTYFAQLRISTSSYQVPFSSEMWALCCIPWLNFPIKHMLLPCLLILFLYAYVKDPVRTNYQAYCTTVNSKEASLCDCWQKRSAWQRSLSIYVLIECVYYLYSYGMYYCAVCKISYLHLDILYVCDIRLLYKVIQWIVRQQVGHLSWVGPTLRTN